MQRRAESLAGPAWTFLRAATVTGAGARVAGFRLMSLSAEGAAYAELLGNVVATSRVYLPLVLRGS